jgi:hypothetical protein
MKIPSVRKLVELYDKAALIAAEANIMDGAPLTIEVEGEDEGEQLTHILSAIQVIEMMETEKIPLALALRNMANKVRTSIN